jgi:anti-sigma B factor antagonist
LRVHVKKLGNISILRLHGRVVIGETDILSNTVRSQVDASAVVLDLAGVTRIDARGLGVALELREQAESRGIEFRIMNVTSLVKQVLKITKLDAVFEVVSERDLASLTTPIRPEETVKAVFFQQAEA